MSDDVERSSIARDHLHWMLSKWIICI